MELQRHLPNAAAVPCIPAVTRARPAWPSHPGHRAAVRPRRRGGARCLRQRAGDSSGLVSLLDVFLQLHLDSSTCGTRVRRAATLPDGVEIFLPGVPAANRPA